MARKDYETRFLSELKQSVLAVSPQDAFWYKIPDSRKFKNPFDVFVSFQGAHFAWETKVHKGEKSWPLAQVKEHQVRGLQKAAQGGYKAYILVKLALDKWSIVRVIPIHEFEEWLDMGIKSLPVVELMKGPHLGRVKYNAENIWAVMNLL